MLFQRQFGAEHRAIVGRVVRKMIRNALTDSGITDASGKPLRFPPTISAESSSPTRSCTACHRTSPSSSLATATSTSRWATRPSTPKKSSTATAHSSPADGRCGPARNTASRQTRNGRSSSAISNAERSPSATAAGPTRRHCIHEHACLRCPLLRPDPAQRPRSPRSATTCSTRIAEAGREGWLGEVEGLQISLAGAETKLTQLDTIAARAATIQLGIPTFSEVARRAATTDTEIRNADPNLMTSNHPGEPGTIAYPIGSLVHLAELLGEIDEFLRSGTDVTDLLTAFMIRSGHTHPGFRVCNLIDDLSFTAHHIRHLVDGIPGERT